MSYYTRELTSTVLRSDTSKTGGLVPTSAAARPDASARRTPSTDSDTGEEQRIRVVNEDGECLGYLGRATSLLPDYWDGCLDAACDEADAFRVMVKPGPDGTKFLSWALISGWASNGRSISALEPQSRCSKRPKVEA